MEKEDKKPFLHCTCVQIFLSHERRKIKLPKENGCCLRCNILVVKKKGFDIALASPLP